MNEKNEVENLNNQIEQNMLIYLLQEKDNSAKIIGNKSACGQIIIPRSIKHESNEYIITSISNGAFKHSKVKSIQFASNSELQIIENEAFSSSLIESISIPPHVTKICERAFFDCLKLKTIEIPSNSELHTIEKNALSFTSIESISIPSSLIELENGWCAKTPKLTEIEISPNNPRYSCLDAKFIIGKSKIEEENYDNLVFSVRDIEEAIIPTFIRSIDAYSFYGCKHLHTVNIIENSELQTIKEYAFSDSNIESFTIPSSLTEICEGAFFLCKQLRSIKTIENSNLRVVNEYAFSFSSIEFFSIPSKLTELKKGWCSETLKLNRIKISSINPRYSLYEDKIIISKASIDEENYDVLDFCVRNIETIKIPNFIKKIGPFAFNGCKKLRNVEISHDSELQIIDEYAFTGSSIERFTITPHLTKIGECSFYYCMKLHIFEIPENSQLQIIDKDAFYNTSITSFAIPPLVTEIGEYAFFECQQLQIIEFDENSNFYSITRDLFNDCEQVLVMIPEMLRDRLNLKS